MKICPKCNQTYDDANLNFCLNDGEFLTDYDKDDAPPTIMMDARTTNPNNWQTNQPPVGQPMNVWQNQSPNYQNQPNAVNQPNYGSPMPFPQSADQVLPTISLVLGVLSLLLVCCYGGIWLGVPAAIVGYLGMRNADSNPTRYGGRGMAIAGIVLGIVSFLMAIGVIFLAIVGSLK